jgi:hypothetical protein
MRRVGDLAILLDLVVSGAAAGRERRAPSKPRGLALATAERVSDGDTVILRFSDRRRERTRLIGLDAPEDHAGEKLEQDVVRTGRDRETILALGRQASAFTGRLLPEGTRVEVEPAASRGTDMGGCWRTSGARPNSSNRHSARVGTRNFSPSHRTCGTRGPVPGLPAASPGKRSRPLGSACAPPAAPIACRSASLPSATVSASRNAPSRPRLGVGRTVVIRWEGGYHRPSAAWLRRLAKLGGVTVEWLRDGGEGRGQRRNRQWEKAVEALRVAWADRRRRAALLMVLQAVAGRRASA